MKKAILIKLLFVLIIVFFGSCHKDEMKVQPLNLSGYTGLFHCYFEKRIDASWGMIDSGYAYVRVQQTPGTWGTVVMMILGPDSNSAIKESYEADLLEFDSFQRNYGRTGCSHCRYTTKIVMNYLTTDSVSFVRFSRVDQPATFDYMDSYTGKRVK